MPRALLPGLPALLGFLALLPWATGSAAQTARSSELDAGDVATVVLQMPAPAGADSADYTLELEPTYRSLGPARGRIGRSGDLFIIPVIFGTPARLPSGDQLAGRLTLVLDDHEETVRTLYVRVRERREIVFQVDVEETTVPPDGVAHVPYRLYNRGNRTDTVQVATAQTAGWTLLDAPRLILEPGDSVHGGLRISAPTSISPGDRQLFVVTATAGDRQQAHTVNVVVVSPSGWLGGLAHVPSSLFVGHALGAAGSGTVAALSGAGRVAPDTDVRVDIRHGDAGVLDPALQRAMSGARLRFSLQRPDLRIAAGDVYNPRSTLTGSFRQARGVDVTYDPDGPLSLGAFAAIPTGFSGNSRGGHILQGEAALATGYGRFGVLAADMLQPALGTVEESRSSGAGFRWGGARGGHAGSVEATLVRLSVGDRDTLTGPAIELDYRLDHDRFHGRFRARRVPDAATTAGGQGNEVSASFTAEILPAVQAVGWGYGTEQVQLGRDSRSDAYSANLGLRTRAGRLQLQLAGSRMERTQVLGMESIEFQRSTVRADASWSRGAFSVQTELEAGEATEFGRDGAYRAAGSSVRWYASGRSVWTRLHHARRPGGATTTAVQAGGSLHIGPVHATGGLNHSLSGLATTTTFWSTTEVEIQRALTIQLGASARPVLDDHEWSFSLGMRRRLSLPLPLARQPDLHGVVFDDANANGVLDAGERLIPGVGLALGYLETVTDEAGEFGFRDANGTPVRVRTGSLPMGYILAPDVVLPARGAAAIPVLRTATLRLDVFLDRDGDGTRDPAESLGSGVVVVLTDARGRQRSATADEEGRVRISGLLPGHYTVTAHLAGQDQGRREAKVLMEVDLAPGAEASHTLAVPLRRRTIRMSDEPGGLPLDR